MQRCYHLVITTDSRQIYYRSECLQQGASWVGTPTTEIKSVSVSIMLISSRNHALLHVTSCFFLQLKGDRIVLCSKALKFFLCVYKVSYLTKNLQDTIPSLSSQAGKSGMQIYFCLVTSLKSYLQFTVCLIICPSYLSPLFSSTVLMCRCKNLICTVNKLFQ